MSSRTPWDLLRRLKSFHGNLLEYLYLNYAVFIIFPMFTRRMLFILTWGWLFAVIISVALLLVIVMLPFILIVTSVIYKLTNNNENQNQNRNRA